MEKPEINYYFALIGYFKVFSTADFNYTLLKVELLHKLMFVHVACSTEIILI